ncbi:hypothetical protein T552_00436 [Pneumocystis carinii B80]|uniref:Uncharacterized protein n=1 Tax=Pneumocystis carinii (strain B80) TaxID=1408658 RepID=A0A0W4ZQT2_PNEC8|nr:hypothetical protein T552_00436 [Pneumocystis carinii B80]KTW30724.1 hypothetical protein T552_00436 [Pneumocystis carinii B80]
MYDLNVLWHGTGVSETEMKRMIVFLVEVGYRTIALNYMVYGKIGKKMINPIRSDVVELERSVRILSRVTVVLEEGSQNYNLYSATDGFDILAVRPMNEKMFQYACTSMDVDIISLDMSQRLTFHIKHSTVSIAIARGIRLEICYGSSISDINCRKNLISNASALIRATRGKGIIISSEASNLMYCRSGYDVINLSTFWGLSQEKGRDAIGKEAKYVIIHGEARKNASKGVIKLVDDKILKEKRNIEEEIVHEAKKKKKTDM